VVEQSAVIRVRQRGSDLDHERVVGMKVDPTSWTRRESIAIR
jgi:hypothetical protein